MIELPAARIALKTYASVTIEIPPEMRLAWGELITVLDAKRITQMYVKLGKPRKPRTTGYRSQNHRIHGNATQIANHVGEDKTTIILDAIDMAQSMLPEFETYMDYRGRVRAKHEPEWSTREAKAVCDALEIIASEVGCKLIEHKYNKDGTPNPNYEESDDG